MSTIDKAAAQGALDALRQSINELKTRTGTDLRNAASAEEGWTGPHADQFCGQELPWIQSEASRILDGMLRLHGAISRALEADAPAASSLKRVN